MNKVPAYPGIKQTIESLSKADQDRDLIKRTLDYIKKLDQYILNFGTTDSRAIKDLCSLTGGIAFGLKREPGEKHQKVIEKLRKLIYQRIAELDTRISRKRHIKDNKVSFSTHLLERSFTNLSNEVDSPNPLLYNKVSLLYSVLFLARLKDFDTYGTYQQVPFLSDMPDEQHSIYNPIQAFRTANSQAIKVYGPEAANDFVDEVMAIAAPLQKYFESASDSDTLMLRCTNPQAFSRDLDLALDPMERYTKALESGNITRAQRIIEFDFGSYTDFYNSLNSGNHSINNGLRFIEAIRKDPHCPKELLPSFIRFASRGSSDATLARFAARHKPHCYKKR